MRDAYFTGQKLAFRTPRSRIDTIRFAHASSVVSTLPRTTHASSRVHHRVISVFHTRYLERDVTCPQRYEPCPRFHRPRHEPYLGRKGTVIIIVAPLARRPFARSRVTSPPRTSTNPAMPTIRRPRLCLRSWPVTPRRSERATSPNGWWLLEAASRGFRAQSTSPTRVTFPSCSSAGTCSAARYRLGRTRTGTGSRLDCTSSSAPTPT